MSQKNTNPGTIITILGELKAYAGPIGLLLGRIFHRRSPEEKLDDEAAKYRRRYARGKLTDEQFFNLSEDIEKRRAALASG